MRIISGIAGGRKLLSPPEKDRNIRPTSDRAREALFNIIGPRVEGAVVLDLFAGTGALGLEALSRGADRLVLVDYNTRALQLIKRNIRTCLENFSSPEETGKMIHVSRLDLRNGLTVLTSLAEETGGFDLIFLDPPYSRQLAEPLLEEIDSLDLMRVDGLVVVEEDTNETLSDTYGRLRLTDQRKYGRNAFWFYERSQIDDE